jgi:hypothetical protein
MEGAARSVNEMSGDLAGLPMTRSRRMAALGAQRKLMPEIERYRFCPEGAISALQNHPAGSDDPIKVRIYRRD